MAASIRRSTAGVKRRRVPQRVETKCRSVRTTCIAYQRPEAPPPPKLPPPPLKPPPPPPLKPPPPPPEPKPPPPQPPLVQPPGPPRLDQRPPRPKPNRSDISMATNPTKNERPSARDRSQATPPLTPPVASEPNARPKTARRMPDTKITTKKMTGKKFPMFFGASFQ